MHAQHYATHPARHERPPGRLPMPARWIVVCEGVQTVYGDEATARRAAELCALALHVGLVEAAPPRLPDPTCVYLWRRGTSRAPVPRRRRRYRD